MKSKVLVIVGPTASGKSDLAVKLAKRLDGEIISADSRQVYKGLDIGTGKITKKEMRGVPHHMLDVASPKKRFTAAEYKKLAEDNIRYIVRSGKLPIIVGGTGFYIDALLGRANLPEVPPNKLLRKKLEKLDKEELFRILKKKDPKRAKTIDRHNKVRLIRALEIINKLGKVPTYSSPPTPSPSSRRGGDSGTPSGGEVVWIGLKPTNLEKRIEERVKKMFRSGLLKEIIKLKKEGVTDKRLKELGFEYWNPTKESVLLGTRQYARRQMTWFKKNKDIKWFESPASAFRATIRQLSGSPKRAQPRR